MELSLFHFDVEMRTDCSILSLLGREHSSSAHSSGACKLAFFLTPAFHRLFIKTNNLWCASENETLQESSFMVTEPCSLQAPLGK